MELGMSSIVWGARLFWSLVVVLCGIGMLPLGSVSEFVRNMSRRGKLKLATPANDLPKYTVPQRWFTHFYVVGSLVNTILLTIAFLFAYACTFPVQSHESRVSAIDVSSLGDAGTKDIIASGGMDNINVGHLAKHRQRAWGSVLLLAMMEVQLLRRLFESFHMFHYSPFAKMHVIGYLVGIGYYPAASFTLFSQHFEDRNYLSSLCKFVAQDAGVLHKDDAPRQLNSQIRLQGYVKSFQGLEAFQWVGLAVFLLGWIQQYRSHSILASLRTKKANTRVEAGLSKPSVAVNNEWVNRYEIPRGSWFEWVSCAHYLAEIVLYVGMVIVSGGNNLNIWLLFVWVVLNLSVAALDTHKWYISKFEDYPRVRRAIVPFIL